MPSDFEDLLLRASREPVAFEPVAADEAGDDWSAAIAQAEEAEAVTIAFDPEAEAAMYERNAARAKAERDRFASRPAPPPPPPRAPEPSAPVLAIAGGDPELIAAFSAHLKRLSLPTWMLLASQAAIAIDPAAMLMTIRPRTSLVAAESRVRLYRQALHATFGPGWMLDMAK